MFITFLRVIKFAFQNFFRNFWLSIITVSMLVLTMLTVNVLIVLQLLGNRAIGAVEERIDATISFRPETSAEALGEVKSFLSSFSQVVNVNEVSAEEALNSFKERHQNNPQILRSLDELNGNPFGPVLVVQARAPEDYQFIFEALENPTYVEFIQDKNFSDHQAVINRITQISDRIKTVGIVLAAIFAVITILIIFNTIRVAIYTHREEIGIMKLVGASNWFVRAPFLIESLIYSVLAILVTAIIVFPALTAVEPYLNNFFDGSRIGLLSFFNQNWLAVFGVELGALVALNVFSSSAAVGRYLKS